MKLGRLRYSVLAMLAVSSMVLASCGETAVTPTATTGAAAPTTAVDTPEATTAPTEAATAEATSAATAAATGTTSAGGEGVIRIISSLPRTGLSKQQTDDVVAGERMALEERGGAVAGFTIDYLDWDDANAQAGKWVAEVEASNATKAANDPDVMVYLGTFNSGAAAVSIPILNKAGLAMISPANTAPELTKAGFDDTTLNGLYISGERNYFRVVTADDVQGAAAASWALELGYKNAYVLNDQEVYGKGVANVFDKTFREKGGTVIANEGIDPKQPEFRSLMQKVKDSGADMVYFGGLIDSGGPQLLKDLRAVDPEIAFMGPDGILTSTYITAAGEDVAQGALGTVAGTDAKDLGPKGQKFFTDFKAKYGRDPDPYAIYGYEAMSVALNAIEKAGKKDRKAILDAIRETKDYEGALGTWSFDENGDTTLTQIRGFKVEGTEWVFQKYLQP